MAAEAKGRDEFQFGGGRRKRGRDLTRGQEEEEEEEEIDGPVRDRNVAGQCTLPVPRRSTSPCEVETWHLGCATQYHGGQFEHGGRPPPVALFLQLAVSPSQHQASSLLPPPICVNLLHPNSAKLLTLNPIPITSKEPNSCFWLQHKELLGFFFSCISLSLSL